MGVPAFYRWLSEKYPKIVEDVLEDRVHLAPNSSIPLPFDATRPNPSGLECDNLYIDMNGIIHPCSHPENGPQPATEEEMYENVCRYVDRLFRVMRPRKLLYLAIDGVAPRAKMNQQRARRFRSAQEARELKELEQHVRDEMAKTGQSAPPVKDAWDSNVITPGTPFMINLAEYVRFYIRKRISTDRAWRQIRVIFSDASVPGEGEHKIMAHVRLQRAQPGYNPNTVHVLHGLDADLIMLALATHEAHFYISREEVLFGRKSQEAQEQRQLESGFRDAQRALDEAAGAEAMQLEENTNKPIQRISIPTLREYLAAEFETCLTQVPFPPSLERLIDDIVFMCFFVGNDFLPHLPSLDIRDGALDFLFNVYKRILPSLGDYITRSGGNVNLSHVDVILGEVGAIEDYVFAMKHENEQRNEQRRKEMLDRKKRGKSDAPPLNAPKVERARLGRAARILEKNEKDPTALSRGHQAKEDSRNRLKAKHKNEGDNLKAAQALKASLGLGGALPDETSKEEAAVTEDVENAMTDDDGPKSASEAKESARLGDDAIETDAKNKKRKQDDATEGGEGIVGNVEDEFEDDGEDDDDEDVDADLPKIDDIVVEVDPAVASAFKEIVKSQQQAKLDEYSKSVVDNVRLHEKGWKDRYYSDKCKADDVHAHGGREHLFRSYVVGLCWVMKYYYDGCASWTWFFPFHYAPFASDLKNIERFQKDVKALQLATPFNPVEQLMAVLPSDSVHAIPKASRWLMLDPESPIIDFYPKDVPVDPNGKAMPWLWVVLLPFIDEERLLAAMSPTMAKWSTIELLCNARGLDDGYLFVHRSHGLARKFSSVLEPGKTAKAPKTRLTDAAAYGCPGFTGAVRPPLSHELYPLDDDVVISAPSTANRITRVNFESIFAEKIEPNDAVCVAFTEPPKLSHKSVLLPGAKLQRPKLTADDKRIRRPRLNRGGATIANMGVSNGQSFQSGYGSMNISSYERDLANKTGRGNQLQQTGTRAWGAMEPTPKRQRQGPATQMPNPFMAHNGQGGREPPPRGLGNQQAWPNQNQHWSGHQANAQGGHAPPYHQHQQQQGYSGGQYHQQRGPPPPPQPYSGYQQPQQQQWQQGRYQQPPSQQRGAAGYGNQGGPTQQGFNFRSFNQPPQQGHPRGPPQGQRGGSQSSQGGRANAAVMNNLKAQLASTLKQNRRQG